jgi:hypothetical protein
VKPQMLLQNSQYPSGVETLNYYYSHRKEQSNYTHNHKPEIATDMNNTKQDALRKHVVLAQLGNLHE